MYRQAYTLLTASGAKDRNTLLAGDFNCPDVDWNTNTVPDSSQERDIQQGLADNMSEAHLSQIHNQPTRLSAILDLVFTTNPTPFRNTVNEKSDAQSGNTSTRPYKKASIRTTPNHSGTLLNPDDATTPAFHYSATEAHSTAMPQITQTFY